MALRHAHAKRVKTPEDFADDLRTLTTELIARCGVRSSRFAVGPLIFDLIGPNDRNHWLGSAFPEIGREVGQPIHRIFVWDGTDPQIQPPSRPWSATAHEPLGVIDAFSNENVRCAFDVHTSSMIVHDRRMATSYIWYPSIDDLPAWGQASPFRIPVSWVLNSHGMQLVHGAAVEISGRAALLAGAGGAGKSTTALACALAGMGYLGDDYCVVDPTQRKVHMLYGTAKVLPSSLAMLPELRKFIVNPEKMDAEKGVMFFKPDEVALRGSADLHSILMPRLAWDGQTRLTPAATTDAIKALLPSTVGGLMGGTEVTAKALLKVAKDAPAFYLELGQDLDTVVATVADHLS